MMSRILFSAVAFSAVAEEQHLSLLQTAVSAKPHHHSVFSANEECKAARTEKRAAKKALKDLRAQLKAAKVDLSGKKAAVDEACPTKKKKTTTTTTPEPQFVGTCTCRMTA